MMEDSACGRTVHVSTISDSLATAYDSWRRSWTPLRYSTMSLPMPYNSFY